MKEERVNHPSHYNHGKLECIDIMEDVFGVDETKPSVNSMPLNTLYELN